MRKRQSERHRRIVLIAQDRRSTDTDVDIDIVARVSEGDDNGAYVQAWVWVDFAGTEFDKEPKPDTEGWTKCSCGCGATLPDNGRDEAGRLLSCTDRGPKS